MILRHIIERLIKIYKIDNLTIKFIDLELIKWFCRTSKYI